MRFGFRRPFLALDYYAMQKIDPVKMISRARYYEVVEDEFTGQIRHPFPRIDGERHVWQEFHLPSDELRDAYESRKQQFTRELNKRLLAELREETGNEDEGDLSPMDIVREIDQRNSLDGYIKTIPSGQYIDRDPLRAEFGISESESKQVKALLVKKWDLDVM